MSQILTIIRTREIKNERCLELTDEELMLAYAEDDMEAFETLYQRHKQRIFGFLIKS